MLLFWLIFLIPWFLDVLSERYVLVTILGATVWGIAVVISLVRARSSDLKIKRLLSYGLSGSLGAWFVLWLLALVEGRAYQLPIETRFIKVLTIAHSALLAAGAGMVVVLWLSTTLWLLKDFAIRRGKLKQHPFYRAIPSLETLTRLTGGALALSFSTWFMGLALAFATAFAVQMQNQENIRIFLYHWISDPKVLVSIFLGLILLIGLQVRSFSSRSNLWAYRIYASLASLFILAFSLLMLGLIDSVHQPVNWFLR